MRPARNVILSAVVFAVQLIRSPAIEDNLMAFRLSTFSTASFIPPASPILNHAKQFSKHTPWSAPVISGYQSKSSSLSSKKGKKAGTTPTTATNKIQVKLLKHVAGTGQAGEIVRVTPAFYQNKLRPTKSAEIISDEQVLAEQAAAAALEKELKELSARVKGEIEREGMVVKLRRKAGPDGQLFGGVGPKVIMDALKAELDKELAQFLDNKSVKVVSILDQEGNKLRGDIKHTGEFTCNISLRGDLSAKLAISIEGEH